MNVLSDTLQYAAGVGVGGFDQKCDSGVAHRRCKNSKSTCAILHSRGFVVGYASKDEDPMEGRIPRRHHAVQEGFLARSGCDLASSGGVNRFRGLWSGD